MGFGGFTPSVVRAGPISPGGFGYVTGYTPPASAAPQFNFGKILTSVVGTIASQAQKSASAERRAGQLEFDAAISRANAGTELQIAQRDKLREERKNKAKEAALRTKFLQGGILLEGSPLLVTQQQVGENALNAADILHKGQVKATRLQQSAAKSQFAADTARSSVGFSLL